MTKIIKRKLKSVRPNALRQSIHHLKHWQLTHDRISLTREFTFLNFKQAIDFVNQVAALAEEYNHHPNILIYNWNKVKIILSTHSIAGVSDKDIMLGSKINNMIVKNKDIK